MFVPADGVSRPQTTADLALTFPSVVLFRSLWGRTCWCVPFFQPVYSPVSDNHHKTMETLSPKEIRIFIPFLAQAQTGCVHTETVMFLSVLFTHNPKFVFHSSSPGVAVSCFALKDKKYIINNNDNPSWVAVFF